jgi:hypothetical protein
MGDIPSRCSIIAEIMTSMSLVVDAKLLFGVGCCGVGSDGGCRCKLEEEGRSCRRISMYERYRGQGRRLYPRK